MYTVSWKSTDTGRRTSDTQPMGFQKPGIDEAEKDRLVASLKADPMVYDIEVEAL